MIFSFVYVVQIMHQRNYCAGDFVRIQQTAAPDVCATSDMLHRLDLRDSSLILGFGVILCGVDYLAIAYGRYQCQRLYSVYILRMMNDRLGRIWKEAVVIKARYCRRNFLGGHGGSLAAGRLG